MQVYYLTVQVNGIPGGILSHFVAEIQMIAEFLKPKKNIFHNRYNGGINLLNLWLRKRWTPTHLRFNFAEKIWIRIQSSDCNS